jgi:hypothetical protein
MRSDVLASAVLCGVQITVKQAQKKFRDWMDRGTRIPPNLREVVYMAGKIHISSDMCLLDVNYSCVKLVTSSSDKM